MGVTLAHAAVVKVRILHLFASVSHLRFGFKFCMFLFVLVISNLLCDRFYSPLSPLRTHILNSSVRVLYS